jgi:hypothetical protein
MKALNIIFILLIINVSTAQVGINTDAPDPSAALDISSTTQGMLPPRMSQSQISLITLPAAGLTIFNTDLDCMTVNYGTPSHPEWICLERKPNASLPSYSISSTELRITTTLNYRTWVNVPNLTATFTLDEPTQVKFDWIMFPGQANASPSNGYAQMFTALEINGTRDQSSVGYMPFIHAPGANASYLLNQSSFFYVTLLPAGTYTINVQLYLSFMQGSTTDVRVGPRINYWTGNDNMTNDEQLNASSNKLLITLLR